MSSDSGNTLSIPNEFPEAPENDEDDDDDEEEEEAHKNVADDIIDTKQWENTNVESIQEIREAEIETKKFAMYKENNEMTSTLVTKEVHLQKQARGISAECGKLRIEVGWLEKDLSQVKETARRQILETQTALQYQRLKLEDEVRERAKDIKELQKKIDQQRDRITEELILARSKKSNQQTDLDSELTRLTKEVEETTVKMAKAGIRFDDSTAEAKKTEMQLITEIRAIKLRSGGLDAAVEKEKNQYTELMQKLEVAEEMSGQIKTQIHEVTEDRAKMRQKITQDDQAQWLNRIQSLKEIDIDFVDDLDADIDI